MEEKINVGGQEQDKLGEALNQLRITETELGKMEEKLSKAYNIAQNGVEKGNGECKEILKEIMATLNS